MEYLGGLSFPAQDYDLHSIPNNERAGRDAAAMMPYIRMCALFLHQTDEELETNVRASGDEPEGLDQWVSMLEGIGAALDAKRQDAGLLEAGFTRLLVVLERLHGEDNLKAIQPDEDASRKFVADARQRLHRPGALFKPRLVLAKQATGEPAPIA